uniref:Putative secreted protein n=1 Tax=Ixodes ricinus TaxID=34613 RepID=A0A6B0UQH1_IXORI
MATTVSSLVMIAMVASGSQSVTSFQHLSITVTLIAAAISVEDSDEASDAVEVIVANSMLKTWKVNEETEARDAERAKSSSACKGKCWANDIAGHSKHDGLPRIWVDPRILHINQFIHETLAPFWKMV